jgi:hypothetical protein
MTPDEESTFVERLLAVHPGLCLDSRSIYQWTSLLATLTEGQRHALLPLARRQEAVRQKAQRGQTRPEWSEDDWFRVAGSYSPSMLITNPPWPTEFDRVLADTQDITDVRNPSPYWVVPDDSDWVFVAEYREVDVPIRAPVGFWVAVKDLADGDPLVEHYGRDTGLAVRYFVRYDNGAPRVLLMRRGTTLARFFAQLTRNGLEDLARSVAGRSKFHAMEGMVQSRLGLRSALRASRTEPSDDA